MKFTYKSQLKSGEKIEGVIDALDKFSAAKQIRERGELPIIITKQHNKSILNFLSFNLGGISLKEKIMFTRNLSGMLQAGLSLVRGLSVLNKQTKNKTFRNILDSLIETINKGGTLSDGMQKFPKTFSTLFISMVKAGEESGSLATTLTEIGNNLQKSFDLNKKIKSALMYPSIIMSAILIIGILMLIYVVPTLTKTFAKIGATLPASTRLVIWLSDSLKNHFLLFAFVVFSFVFGIIFISRLKATQKYFDFVLLHIPILGTLIKEMNTARTARTLSSLLSAGVPVSKSLSITKGVLQNFYYKKVVDSGIEAIEKGKPLSETFKSNLQFYPVMVGEMMEVGEETGNFSNMLTDIAVFYENEVDTKTKDLSVIIEPILMIIIGAAVGFFAISMITPMYSILDSIK